MTGRRTDVRAAVYTHPPGLSLPQVARLGATVFSGSLGGITFGIVEATAQQKDQGNCSPRASASAQ